MRTRRTQSPPLTAAARARFRNIVIPSNRGEHDDDMLRIADDLGAHISISKRALATVGDVLDRASGGRCHKTRLRTWRSSKDSTPGMRRVTCGHWDCPFCLEEILVDVFGPAWGLWGGTAERSEHATDEAWRWERQKSGVNVNGPNATAGIVNIPGDGEARVVWTPVGTLTEGTRLAGKQLDIAYVADIRAVRLGERGTRTPNPDAMMASLPDAPDIIDSVAQRLGFPLRIGKKEKSYGDVPITPEQLTEFVHAVRQEVFG